MNQSEATAETMQSLEMSETQKVINRFFEGYGAETVKEYGNTLFDLVSILKENNIITDKLEKEVFSKFNSIFRLISELEPTPSVNEPYLN